ncbi:uncharacterized protein LOC117899145 isoform X2 [Drosophila subobscura]|uniref:uncharacterized protein LOC117899145 isoform X2 n=1 Tax=Drosophila subobscura TaxID=7241 RepID=UPI00155A166C|nr:uncharacterized protein LOC117899145 isoform X2 [Drosophila subobscura]
MSFQRGTSGGHIQAPSGHKLTTKQKRLPARAPWHNELYKYNTSPHSEMSSAPYKKSYAPPREEARLGVSICARCINKKVSPMESTASLYSKSFSHPSRPSNRHLGFSALDRSRLDMISSSRHSQLLNCLRLNVSTSSHCSDVSKRLKELARSKQPPKIFSAKQPWHLTGSMRTFQPSERLLKLACSTRPSTRKLYNPFSVALRALTYKATERINLLAVPKKKTPTIDVSLEIPSRPTRKRLPGQQTPRLKNLATPKLREDTTIRRKPYTVRRRAMRAKLTPRLEKLAQPRQLHSRSGKEKESLPV